MKPSTKSPDGYAKLEGIVWPHCGCTDWRRKLNGKATRPGLYIRRDLSNAVVSGLVNVCYMSDWRARQVDRRSEDVSSATGQHARFPETVPGRDEGEAAFDEKLRAITQKKQGSGSIPAKKGAMGER